MKRSSPIRSRGRKRPDTDGDIALPGWRSMPAMPSPGGEADRSRRMGIPSMKKGGRKRKAPPYAMAFFLGILLLGLTGGVGLMDCG